MEKTAKSKKEAREEKLKEKKIEEQLLKSLSLDTTSTVDEKGQKFDALLKKYVDITQQLKQRQHDFKSVEKQCESFVREKDNLQKEYNKSVLIREKLQDVCREQQKVIYSIKNDSLQKIREEEELRKETQSKFQSSLNEITQSLNKNNEENLKLRDHNIEMTKKLKFLAEQYATREKQLEKLNEQVQLEAQLSAAKLDKAQVEAAMEKEILIKEKEIALEKLQQTQSLLAKLTEREVELKKQLFVYTEKYDDFQNSLQKSTSIFATYKVELEKMSKNTKKIEREALEWEHKWEKSNAKVIELATEKQERDEHAARCTRQVEMLQKLLRVLQKERTHLYSVLRENNIEVPTMPLPPEPEPLDTKSMHVTSEKDKMEKMTQNCAELKLALSNLQQQMTLLTQKKVAENEDQSKVIEKQQQQQQNATKKRNKKKNKSKNNKKINEDIKESTPTSECSSVHNNEETVNTATAIVSTNDDDDNDADGDAHNADISIVALNVIKTGVIDVPVVTTEEHPIKENDTLVEGTNASIKVTTETDINVNDTVHEVTGANDISIGVKTDADFNTSGGKLHKTIEDKDASIAAETDGDINVNVKVHGEVKKIVPTN